MMSPTKTRATVEELLARADWVRTLAVRLVQDAQLADDVVQATYLAAIQCPPDDGASADAWLRRVVRNVASVIRRGDRRRAEREARIARPEASGSGAIDHVSEMEAQRRVVDAVLRLEEPYRKTIVLRYYEGLSSAEIARREGIPSATVRGRIKRALERLRAELDRDGGRAAWLPLLGALAAAATATGSAAAAQAQLPAQASPVSWLKVGAAVGVGVVFVGVSLFLLGPFLEPHRIPGAGGLTNDVASRSTEAPAGLPKVPFRHEPDTTASDEEQSRDLSGSGGTPPAEHSRAAPGLRVRATFADGSPAPDCLIRVDRNASYDGYPVTWRAAHYGLTDADGIAEIGRVEEGDLEIHVLTGLPMFHDLTGNPDLFSADPVPVRVDDRETQQEVTVVVSSLTSVRGRVVDSRGSVVHGAKLLVERARWGDEPPDPLESHGPPIHGGGGSAGADGGFHLRAALRPGEEHVLVARFPSFEREVRVPFNPVPGGDVDVGDIVLGDCLAATVRCTVVPRRGAVLEVFDEDESENYASGFTPNGDGVAVIAPLFPGRYVLRFRGREDIEPIPFEVRSPGEVVDLGTIELEPEPREHPLLGFVVNEDGSPVAEARVSADSTSVTTDEDGSFEIRARTVGPHLVSARVSGLFQAYTAEPVEFDGRSIVLRPVSHGLAFRLRDADSGAPIHWTRAQVYSFPIPRDGYVYVRRVPGEGDADLLRTGQGHDPGIYRFAVQVDGYEIVELVAELPPSIHEQEHVIPVDLRRL